MKTIFVVDDSDVNLTTAEEALETRYQVMTMPSAAKMFTILEKVIPDLILLDIEMPDVNGFDALQRLKSNNIYVDIPVIFLTGYTDTAIEARGFELGAVDFVTKPFSVPVLLNRIKTHLDIDEIIQDRTSQLRQLQNGIVSALANIVENRDRATGGHIERTTAYIKILLQAMKENGVYTDEICNWNFETTILSARLHDVGKIVVSDLILNKCGKLTEEEYIRMKTHTLEGERIIEQIIASTGENDFLHSAKLFAACHHERWDGMGYPRGLKETEIPLQGRIMAIVDMYDALTSARPYKEAFTEEESARIIITEAGRYFDPEIVRVFSQVKDLFGKVAVCSDL